MTRLLLAGFDKAKSVEAQDVIKRSKASKSTTSRPHARRPRDAPDAAALLLPALQAEEGDEHELDLADLIATGDAPLPKEYAACKDIGGFYLTPFSNVFEPTSRADPQRDRDRDAVRPDGPRPVADHGRAQHPELRPRRAVRGGAYFLVSVRLVGNFWLGLLIAPLGVAILGLPSSTPASGASTPPDTTTSCSSPSASR